VRHLGLAFDIVAIGAALAMKLFVPSRLWVETAYSNGLYPRIDGAVRAVTGPIPFTLGDVLFVLALVALVIWWARSLRGVERPRLLPRIGRVALRTAALGAFLFVWFIWSWAYNYSRLPVADKVVLHNERTNSTSVAALADRVVDELNRNVKAAHRKRLTHEEAGARLLPTFSATIARLGDRFAFAPPRIKPTIFQSVMEWTGTDGFTDPWTHEVNVDSGAYFFEWPALYAHEWGHISGFADEAEANFISVLACTNAADPLLRYSGWILTWFNLPSNAKVTHRMDRQAYRDIMAIQKRYLAHINRTAEHVQRIAYNSYLKANHVEAGYASYQIFVRWLTGADFDRSGLPIVRQGVP
jgi:hypothetical protein